jgi:hypothetical protein
MELGGGATAAPVARDSRKRRACFGNFQKKIAGIIDFAII